MENLYNLIESKFKEMGYNDENPSDIELISNILRKEIEAEREGTEFDEIYWSQEELILLNDKVVREVLNNARDFYNPTRDLTRQSQEEILSRIADGSLKSKAYDFKMGGYITTEPTFTERIQAIRLLQEMDKMKQKSNGDGSIPVSFIPFMPLGASNGSQSTAQTQPLAQSTAQPLALEISLDAPEIDN